MFSTNVLFFISITIANGYKILGLFPLPVRSHYIMYDSLMTGFAERGHQVTVYTTFPKKLQQLNYFEVDISSCIKSFNNTFFTDIKEMKNGFGFRLIDMIFSYPSTVSVEILECQKLKDLVGTQESYDVFITETFSYDFFQLFGPQLKLPVIIIHSTDILPWMSNLVGLPYNPSFMPFLFDDLPLQMNFGDRLHNTIVYLYSMISYHFKSERVFEDTRTKFFRPSSVPPLSVVIRNSSLLFLNSHFSLNMARPSVPNVVDIGGIHIKEAQPLPTDIEKFINESNDGVIYFSMGSLLRSNSFPEEKRNAFIFAFSKIPQRVLWKWDGNDLPGKTNNVMISKWLPQRDLLAHPNIKLFISHGGLLSTIEAVYEAVPILAIPMFADQKINTRLVKENGAGEIMDYFDVSNETILKNVQQMINDPKYKLNAEELSRRYRDRPLSPLDTAVYWMEYVIRHKGAHHLKTVAINMPWYQYLLLDVIAFLLLILILVTTIIYYVTKKGLTLICERKITKIDKARHKMKSS